MERDPDRAPVRHRDVCGAVGEGGVSPGEAGGGEGAAGAGELDVIADGLWKEEMDVSSFSF